MILKCKMCGGDIELSADKTCGICSYCGSTMTFPKVDDEQRANRFNRGNQFRRAGEFDKALAVYEQIVQEDENDAEAHWCCALCRFGIEYVEDPNTLEYLPTCHRASFDSFLEDVDYLAAVEHSDGITRRQYQKDAAKIAEVQRGILATSQNEEPFDVFICYKETEDDGTRTRDSLYAQDIYYQLTEQGRRVFFSRITLEDKAGTEYEPYIFAALNSAKVMILVTTSAEHANSVWVKNEWSRFLSLMRKDRTKLLLPCYRDMDPYDLPEALSVLQSYDMGKIGFIQDLIRGVNKVLNAAKPKAQTVKEAVVIQPAANPAVTPLLKRAFLFLEDGNWANADEYCEKVLDMDPENGEAYLGKLMTELRVRKREALRDCAQPFDGSNNYQKALRFADDALKKDLTGAIVFIQDRNETARAEDVYQKALQLLKQQKYTDAKGLFDSISDYKDAAAQSKACTQKAEEARKNGIYSQACVLMKKDTDDNLVQAAKLFKTIPGWMDADENVALCQKRVSEIEAQREAERLEAERRAEEKRVAEEKRRKKKRTTGLIVALLAVAGAAAFFVWTKVIQPKQQYNKAMALYDAGQYEQAIAAFEELNGYKDSGTQIEACRTAIKDQAYDAAMALYDAGQYEQAIAAFEALDGYKDSTEKASKAFYKSANVGDYILFGAYEQDNKKANGKEDIEWLVLAREGDKVLVISRYALDCQQYNSSYSNVTWETCTLRKWLNETFISDAFNSYEQAMIQSTTVTADKNPSYSTSPGNNTTDKVFLLSVTEVNKYFNSNLTKECKGTEFCYAQGASKTANKCWWWLRSPGYDFCSAVRILSNGSVNIYGNGVNRDDGAVRPAMWIDLGTI